MATEGQKQSRKHEERLAKELGGTRVGGSGAGWSHKLDVRAPDILLEHKWTSRGSYSVTAKLWREVETQAVKISRTPLLGIRLELSDIDLIVMDEDDFLEMRLELSQLREAVVAAQKIPEVLEEKMDQWKSRELRCKKCGVVIPEELKSVGYCTSDCERDDRD